LNAFLYCRRIPDGEENLLFQYHVASINDDNKTAVIEYDEKAITNGHHQFTNYPDVTGSESSIDNYDLGTFKEDHELYLQHLGRCNKVQYEAHQAQKNKEQEEAAAAAKDISDIHLKLENGVEAYDCSRASSSHLVHYEIMSWAKEHIKAKFTRSRLSGLVGVYNGKVKELWVGKVVEKGKNLPSKKNLADYIDERGRIQLIAFFRDHRKSFPTLWNLVQKEASRRVTEVGCKRFFALSGYVSAPRRTRLGVRNYERLAMLSSIVH
jgi:hypothetical protein